MQCIKVLYHISNVSEKMFCQKNHWNVVKYLQSPFSFLPTVNMALAALSKICQDWYMCHCAGDRVWSRAGDWKPFIHGQGWIYGNALERGHHFELHTRVWRWSLSLCGQQPTWDRRPWHRRAQPHCFGYHIFIYFIILTVFSQPTKQYHTSCDSTHTARGQTNQTNSTPPSVIWLLYNSSLNYKFSKLSNLHLRPSTAS